MFKFRSVRLFVHQLEWFRVRAPVCLCGKKMVLLEIRAGHWYACPCGHNCSVVAAGTSLAALSEHDFAVAQGDIWFLGEWSKLTFV